MIKSRPVLTADLFDQAVSNASLTDEEKALIEFVRYTGVIDELILRKGLSLPAKPPALCRLSNICEKIGATIPDHFRCCYEMVSGTKRRQHCLERKLDLQYRLQ